VWFSYTPGVDAGIGGEDSTQLRPGHSSMHSESAPRSQTSVSQSNKTRWRRFTRSVRRAGLPGLRASRPLTFIPIAFNAGPYIQNFPPIPRAINVMALHRTPDTPNHTGKVLVELTLQMAPSYVRIFGRWLGSRNNRVEASYVPDLVFLIYE